MRPHRYVLPTLLAAALLVTVGVGVTQCPQPVERARVTLPGLSGRVLVSTDERGVPHVEAETIQDAVRTEGYLHARDRFFQMDLSRRSAYGRRAEMTGVFSDLTADAQLRILDLAAAAQRDLDLLDGEELALLQAYADGVNAYLATNPLPSQYAKLHISTVPPWTVLDTLTLGKANVVQSSVLPYEPGQDQDLRSYQSVLGESKGLALWLDDVMRVDPIVPVATVPDAGGELPFVPAPSGPTSQAAALRGGAAPLEPPGLFTALADQRGGGSNVWGIAASRTAEGVPLIAYDPHLEANAQALYEIHLMAEHDPQRGRVNVSGIVSPGLPGVNWGQSEYLAWGVTAAYVDDVDYFWDTLVRGDARCPARLCIESAGELHPVEEGSETYSLNNLSGGLTDLTQIVASVKPEAVQTLRVPFRSFGPIVTVTDRSAIGPGDVPARTPVLTVQAVGFHGGREVRCQLGLLTAESIDEFDAALDFCSRGNFVFADRGGRLAYRLAGEIPLRADLETGQLHGDLPIFFRDGSGPANWIPDPARSQGQLIPFAVIPRDEMPHVVDPPTGFVVSSNNDALGEGFDNDLLNQRRRSNPQAIYYLGPNYVSQLRAGGITRMVHERIDAGEKLAVDDLKGMQADTRLLDAQLLVPFLFTAYVNAAEAGAPASLAAFRSDPEIAAAIARLEAWDFSTPTGIPEGYDASDVDGQRTATVSPEEAAHSVAATIYSVWRAKLIKNTMLRALGELGLHDNDSRITLHGLLHLLKSQPFTGVGGSGLDFFAGPVDLADPGQRRDYALLSSLRGALDALASSSYAAAFGNSTDQNDYRWGRLHRLVLSNPLGETIPPGGGFADLVPGVLRGMARDGGLETPNRGESSAYADGANAFVMECGAVCSSVAAARLVMAPGDPDARPDGVLGYASLRGGASEDPLSDSYASQLGTWLTVDYHRMPMNERDVRAAATRVELFEPTAPAP